MNAQLNFFDERGGERDRMVAHPEGFGYQPDLITATEEDALIAQIRELPFREFEFHGYLGKRRVVSFGWHYDYTGRALRKAPDIPEVLLPLRERAVKLYRSFGD